MNSCEIHNLTIQQLVNSSGGIPEEYQQVAYLQSTGAQCIDTGTSVTSNLQIILEFELTASYPYSNSSAIFGAYIGEGLTVQVSYSASFPASTLMRIPYDTAYFGNYTIPNISSGTHYLLYRSGYQYLDDTYISNQSGAADNTTPLRLFGRYSTQSNSRYITSGVRIYHVQLGTAENATQYQDLYPVYRKSDNVTGMYDIIKREFIPYTGTENFIVGDNVF